MKTKFDIQGMTCSSCSAHVEKAVKNLQGIQLVNVNLLSNNMIVEYDEKIINSEDIIKAVIDAGYGASITDEETKEKDKKAKKIKNEDAIQTMKKKGKINEQAF